MVDTTPVDILGVLLADTTPVDILGVLLVDTTDPALLPVTLAGGLALEDAAAGFLSCCPLMALDRGEAAPFINVCITLAMVPDVDADAVDVGFEDAAEVAVVDGGEGFVAGVVWAGCCFEAAGTTFATSLAADGATFPTPELAELGPLVKLPSDRIVDPPLLLLPARELPEPPPDRRAVTSLADVLRPLCDPPRMFCFRPLSAETCFPWPPDPEAL